MTQHRIAIAAALVALVLGFFAGYAFGQQLQPPVAPVGHGQPTAPGATGPTAPSAATKLPSPQPPPPAASAPPASTLTPTEVQALRLKVAQEAAVIAQKDMEQAQREFQARLAALNAEAERVRDENKWPADTTFDIGTLQFREAPKPAAKTGKP